MWNSPEQRLWNACIDGDAEKLKGVISAANLDSYNTDGFAAVHLVVKHGWADLLDLLLDAEADVLLLTKKGPKDHTHMEGYTATHMAAMLPGRTDCLTTLLRRGSGTLFARSTQGWTALHCAAFSGRYEALRLLLEKDAEPDCQAHDGRTPLMMAAAMSMTRAVRLLLGGGASVALLDKEGHTVLHYALDTKSQRILAGKVPLKADNYETAYLVTLAGCPHDVISFQGIKALDFAGPHWKSFYETVHRHRGTLMRGGGLPFSEPHSVDVPTGLTFAELLGAEHTTLLSIGIPADEVAALKTTLNVVWAEVNHLQASKPAASAAASPRRRYGKPSPAAQAPQQSQWYQTAVWKVKCALYAAACLFFVWVGVLAERYSDSSTLLFFVAQLQPDPFAPDESG
eukprot:TRINITY_DN11015_c0_g1_i1.p1 TRINITY_DN11015_c0_g1~~TRINITY_DN11015_c0_g1_i1.p1  ORF type:complete len:399 (+),score=141.63 TRINITY_DN11015_c0_g1_i1:892-2088(+)